MKNKAKSPNEQEQKKNAPETAVPETAVPETEDTAAVPEQQEPAESTLPEETTATVELKEKVASLEKEKNELAQKRLLLLAEMDNQRKRIAKEMESTRYNVMQDTLSPFLQVFDHFTMAVSAAANSDNHQSLVQGLEMIQKEFDRAFSELGVRKIDAVGKEFDPKLHEAVAQEASDDVPAGIVIRQWSCGYASGERLLKPAMVVVSSGPAAAN